MDARSPDLSQNFSDVVEYVKNEYSQVTRWESILRPGLYSEETFATREAALGVRTQLLQLEGAHKYSLFAQAIYIQPSIRTPGQHRVAIHPEKFRQALAEKAAQKIMALAQKNTQKIMDFLNEVVQPFEGKCWDMYLNNDDKQFRVTYSISNYDLSINPEKIFHDSIRKKFGSFGDNIIEAFGKDADKKGTLYKLKDPQIFAELSRLADLHNAAREEAKNLNRLSP